MLLSNGGDGWDPPAMLLTRPLVILRFKDGHSRLFAAGSDEPFFEETGDPLALIDSVLARLQQHVPPAGPKAGKPSFPLAMVAAAYEFGRFFVPHQHAFPHAKHTRDDDLFAAFAIDAYRPDRLGGTERFGYSGSIPAGWFGEGSPQLVAQDFGHSANPIEPWPVQRDRSPAPLSPASSDKQFAEAIHRIHEYLLAGDIYQANFTLPFFGRTNAGAEDIFDVALESGGAPFAGTMITPSGSLVSFSPELFLRRRGPEIVTRPIKGTRAISKHATEEDRQAIRRELENAPKDRAEHVMIVDLERNDIGRVCEPGSVIVHPFMEAREHPTVMHLESAVKGTLREGVTMSDLFASLFPGGSVTGAPKKRALEIISELESTPRGIYCGAFGWIDCEGDCELSLPIRTAMIRPEGSVEYHAGGGIVIDSKPDAEWQEVRAKTRFFTQTLKNAEEICRYDGEEH